MLLYCKCISTFASCYWGIGHGHKATILIHIHLLPEPKCQIRPSSCSPVIRKLLPYHDPRLRCLFLCLAFGGTFVGTHNRVLFLVEFPTRPGIIRVVRRARRAQHLLTKSINCRVARRFRTTSTIDRCRVQNTLRTNFPYLGFAVMRSRYFYSASPVIK